MNIFGLYLGTPPMVPQFSGWTVRDNVAIQTTDGTQSFDSGYVDIVFPYTGVVNATNSNALTPAHKIHHFFDHGVFHDNYYGLPFLPLALQEFSNGNVGGFYGDIREGSHFTMRDPPIYPSNP